MYAQEKGDISITLQHFDHPIQSAVVYLFVYAITIVGMNVVTCFPHPVSEDMIDQKTIRKSYQII